MKTGVYLLIYKRKVVYVGQTTRWPNRLVEHKEIQFTDARLFECDYFDLHEYERRFIGFFKPKHNVSATNKRTGKKVTIEWIAENKDFIKNSIESGDTNEMFNIVRNKFGYSPKYTKPDLLNTLRHNFERLYDCKWNWSKRKFIYNQKAKNELKCLKGKHLAANYGNGRIER